MAKKHIPRNPSASDKAKKARAAKILLRLKKQFPSPKTALLHKDAFQLLIATILSAQCTDERVNIVTKGLFRKYHGPKDFVAANVAELEQDIRSTGFFRMKAKNIMGCSKALVENFGGRIPKTIDGLVTLAGVGRKTANVVLGQAYGIVSGVVVDTHVHRLSRRMGLSVADTAETIEQDLMDLFPRKDWINVGTVMMLHGRRTCNARKPKCVECIVNDLCPSAEIFMAQQGKTG